MNVHSLRDLRIIDLSEYISGPYCTKLLAGWGAEVVKVENPGEGDGARKAGPFPGDEPHLEKSALFLYLNTNKRSITLNLRSAAGISILKEMISDADVLVENSVPGAMSDLGLDYSTLEELNPGLVMTSISPFGQTGPYQDYGASSIICYAMGGQMYVCGLPDREPLNTAVSIPEYIGGMYAFVGTMMALHTTRQTGAGQHVDISIMECLAGSHQFTLTWPAYSGVLLERPGWPGSRAPMAAYECSDGYIILRLVGIEVSLLATLLDKPGLLEDPRFQTLEARTQNTDELEAIVAEGVAGMSKQDIFRTCGDWRQLSGYVATPEDLLNDPHYLARDFWVEVDHPVAGRLNYPGAPARLTETTWRTDRAPLLGEHNQEVYYDLLGYSREDLVKLGEAGIV